MSANAAGEQTPTMWQAPNTFGDYLDYIPDPPPPHQRDGNTQSPTPQIPSKSTSPQPRSSSDSLGRQSTSGSKWRESPTLTVSTMPNDTATLVDPAFDENILRALCDLDVSLTYMYTLFRSMMRGIVQCAPLTRPIEAECSVLQSKSLVPSHCNVKFHVCDRKPPSF
jgi:hypothetical protein